ncbi:MAG TPA: hypothetical protein RMF84_13110 [Polyangiaceae bacterium LLY-WYZ-14_1]|nr:hypothetical protein [Polyangiaceae bacterium LLY-WYZ-14_1]
MTTGSAPFDRVRGRRDVGRRAGGEKPPRPRARRRAPTLGAGLVGVVGLAGCPGDGGAGDAEVTLGTGCFGEFSPLRVPDGELTLEPGNQGLQHVWVAARTAGLPPRGLTTRFRILALPGAEADAGGDAIGDVELAARRSTFAYERFDGVADGDLVLTGVRVVVPDREAALAGAVRLRVEVRSREDDPESPPLAADEQRVRLTLGTTDCGS